MLKPKHYYYSLSHLSRDIETNPGPTLINNLIFSHSNVRSLLAKRSDEKIAELQLMATEHQINVLSLSETWLNNFVPEELLTSTGFQKSFSRNREIRSGGGVAVYCANHIPADMTLRIQVIILSVYG